VVGTTPIPDTNELEAAALAPGPAATRVSEHEHLIGAGENNDEEDDDEVRPPKKQAKTSAAEPTQETEQSEHDGQNAAQTNETQLEDPMAGVRDAMDTLRRGVEIQAELVAVQQEREAVEALLDQRENEATMALLEQQENAVIEALLPQEREAIGALATDLETDEFGRVQPDNIALEFQFSVAEFGPVQAAVIQHDGE
jgi:hypothetical protein